MALIALDVEKAQPGQTAYKLFDRRGLYLLVSPTGSKFWKFKYRSQGIEKKLALGRYPDLGLAQARIACDAARVKVAAGQDPSGEKRLARLTAKWSRATTFAAVAAELFEKAEREKRAPATIIKMRWALDPFPVQEVHNR